MDELYLILRVALSVGCIAVVFRYRFSSLSAYLAVDAFEHAVPAILYSPAWWRHVSLPIRVVQLVAAIWAMAWIMRRCAATMYPIDRRYLTGTSWLTGAAVGMIGFYWVPREPFHAFDSGRQFCYMGMLVSFGVFLEYLGRRRWLELDRESRVFAIGWLAWMGFQFLGSITGAGNLLWDVVPWKGGAAWWYGVSCASLAGQIAVCLWWALNHLDSGYTQPYGRSRP